MPESTPVMAVLGSANVDYIVRCARLPAMGETVIGEDVVRRPGGKGANQAVAAARLGAAVSLIACVGNDADGQWLSDELARSPLDLTRVQRADRPTGVALIEVDHDGENTIVVAPGANERVDLVPGTLGGFDVVLTQLEIPHDVVESASRDTSRLVLNAAPARELAPGIVERCWYVIVNEGEAANLETERVARLVVTSGSAGARYLEHGVERARCGAPRVEVVDTVGAGDAFCASFAWRVALGDHAPDALAYAVTAGALATRQIGAQGSLPTHEEVVEWLARAS